MAFERAGRAAESHLLRAEQAPMTERTSDRKDLVAVLAFISGAIVIVASLGSLVLTLFAVIGIHI